MIKLFAFLIFLIPSICTAELYPPVGENQQIVFIGDSITRGDIGGEPNTYPYHFCNEDTTCVSYLNKGIGSNKIADVVTRWDADVVANSPKYVFILIGVNDVSIGTTKSVYLSNYTTLLDSCVTNSFIPVVIAMLPWTNGTNEQMQTMDDWNASLKTLVETYSTYVWVDVRSDMGQFREGGDVGNHWDYKTGYSTDGIHPNNTGYDYLATYIWAKVNASKWMDKPWIDSKSGQLLNGQSVTILGFQFETKSTAAPLFFDNFNNGTHGNNIKGNVASHQGSWLDISDDAIPTYTSSNQRSSGLSSYHHIACNDTANNHAPCYAQFSESHKSTVLLSLWQRYDWSGITGEGNIKQFRITDGVSDADDHTSLQIGQQAGAAMTAGFMEMYLDAGNAATWPSTSDTTLNFTYSQATWQQFIIMLKASSDNTPNGTAKIWHNGVQLENTAVMETWDSSDAWKQLTLGWYCANYSAGDVYLQYDDVYIDDSFQSVWICSENSFPSSHCEVQIPSAWAANSITVTVNRGSFALGETAYLFVIDSNGNASAGYEIVFSFGFSSILTGVLMSGGKID